MARILLFFFLLLFPVSTCASSAAPVLSKVIFGAQLGESTQQLEKRCEEAGKELDKDGLKFADPDMPSKIFRIQGALNGNASIDKTHFYLYKNMIYTISVYFKDSSLKNYNTIKYSLARKYGDNYAKASESKERRSIFNTKINKDYVIIVLDREEVYGSGNDILMLTYEYVSLSTMVDDEHEKRKLHKIEDDL